MNNAAQPIGGRIHWMIQDGSTTPIAACKAGGWFFATGNWIQFAEGWPTGSPRLRCKTCVRKWAARAD